MAFHAAKQTLGVACNTYSAARWRVLELELAPGKDHMCIAEQKEVCTSLTS